MEIELEIVNPGHPNIHGEAFNLVLQEKGGTRFVPVIIGLNEARALLLALGDVETARPLTHDLLLQTIHKMGGDVSKITVTDFVAGAYIVEVAVETATGICYLDARLSDAAVLSVKTGVPIMMDAVLFQKVSYTHEGKVAKDDEAALARYFDAALANDDEDEFYVCADGLRVPMDLRKATDRQLDLLMQEALARENYELAAEIDNEIKIRKADGK